MNTGTPAIPIARVPAALRRVLLHPYVLYLTLCLVVWLPDGFNIGPANDGWRSLGAEPPSLEPQLRFFGKIPSVIGLNLVSGGFQGWEWMLLLVTVLRAVAVFETFRRLFPMYRSFAVACGLLALFHPADRVYFWMDSLGLDFDYLIGLGCCLAAVVYLQTRSRESLLSLLFLQFVLCFSYTAYLPLVAAFSIGIWLLRRMEGQDARPSFFLAAVLPTLLAIAFQALIAIHGADREGKLMDMKLRAVMGGYAHEASLLAPMFLSVFRGLPSLGPRLLLMGLPAVLAYFVVGHWRGPASEAEKPAHPWRFYAVLVGGLLALAAIGYLPYAVSKIRFGAERQLLVAGLFVYVTLLLPLFFWLLPRMASRRAEAVVLAVLAGFVAVTGLENRDSWVTVYRNNERFLSALAAVVPAPRPGTTIIVQSGGAALDRKISGLHHRRINFEQALQYMYGDGTLKGAFLADGPRPLRPVHDGVEIAISDPKRRMRAALDSLLVVSYSASGKLSVLDRESLQAKAPPGAGLSAYAPAGRYSMTPGKTAITCSMFEKGFRPAYCPR